MKINILFILSLFLLLASSGKSQQVVFVHGQITALETGLPVAQKAVSIGFSPALPITTEYTNNEGHYAAQFVIQPNDSVSLLYVTVMDCNQLPVSQTFSILDSNQIQADFQLCTLTGNCQASFIYRQDSLNQRLVYFENLSGPVTSSTKWEWDFGDGSIAQEFNPVHEFAAPGIYTVCLTMVDSAAGCSSNLCLEVVAGNPGGSCQALFGWDNQDLTVAFTDLSAGTPGNWLWSFGDGTSSTEQNPIHTWTVPGTYQVCLSISNDFTLCYDTICESINLVNTQCHAGYTYQQTGNNTLAFTNQSTGFIDQYNWDFGDGTTSAEYSPVHTWNQAGIYHVCLAVISNYFGCADVFCSDITVGDTVTACQAGFSVMFDSVPGNMNHYWFTDTSTGINISQWAWDFGDGAISFIQNTEYTYAESGTYEVCLTISGQGNGGYCSGTICKTITTPSYSNLGGQVFAGNFPINNPSNTGDTAFVSLYRKSGNHLSEVASGSFFEYGYYFFLNVPEGNYVVHAGLTPASNTFDLYLPGYSGETQYWQQAQQVSLAGSDVFDANVTMPEFTQTETGPGAISGSLVCIDNSGTDLQDRIIYLSHGGNIVAFTYTNVNGAFGFPDLPLMDYNLKAEIAGKYSQSIDINLTEFENQAFGTLIQVASSGVFGFGDEPGTGLTEIKLYPNPANDYISLEINLDKPSRLVSEIFTSSGITCLKSEHACAKSVNTLIINVNSLKPGFYLIALKSDEGQTLTTLKFAKK